MLNSASLDTCHSLKTMASVTAASNVISQGAEPPRAVSSGFSFGASFSACVADVTASTAIAL